MLRKIKNKHENTLKEVKDILIKQKKYNKFNNDRKYTYNYLKNEDIKLKNKNMYDLRYILKLLNDKEKELEEKYKNYMYFEMEWDNHEYGNSEWGEDKPVEISFFGTKKETDEEYKKRLEEEIKFMMDITYFKRVNKKILDMCDNKNKK